MRIRTSNLFGSGQMSQGALPNFSHGTLVVIWLEVVVGVEVVIEVVDSTTE